MDIEIIYELPTAQDYVNLRLRSGMGNKDLKRSQTALENSLFTASIYDGDILVGFGRVVGDGGITYVVSDIMVDEKYRRKGFADRIMEAIDQYFEKNTHEDSYICLIANRPADMLYNKHKFEYLSEDKCGMLRKQNDNRNV
ncbi:MAG: GNAT family N-acetyltransferase [Mobilitalea sp.]